MSPFGEFLRVVAEVFPVSFRHMLRLDHRIALFLVYPHMGCNPSLPVENLNDVLRQLDVCLSRRFDTIKR